MTEQKKKRILSLISKSYVDPTTKLPHPPLRIENAMEEANINIDPFRDPESQVQDIVKELRPLLPMSSENVKIAVKIPPEYTGKSYGIVKDYATIKKEEWMADGSLVALLEVPAAMHGELLERLGKATQGTIQSKMMK
jgi:ribosome maturation protein SDO1